MNRPLPAPAPRIAAIVAMAENQVIGRGNQLPWHLPEDLKHFKTITMGKPVIMGRKTFESIGKPLPGRTNIVISRQFSALGIIVVPDLRQAVTLAKSQAAQDRQTEIIIIGGGQIYAESLALLDRIYLTQVHQTITDGDTWFPKLTADWAETARDDRDGYSFKILERRT